MPVEEWWPFSFHSPSESEASLAVDFGKIGKLGGYTTGLQKTSASQLIRIEGSGLAIRVLSRLRKCWFFLTKRVNESKTNAAVIPEKVGIEATKFFSKWKLRCVLLIMQRFKETRICGLRCSSISTDKAVPFLATFVGHNAGFPYSTL